MIWKRRSLAVATIVFGLLAGACQQPAPQDTRASGNPEKYARDRSLCLGQSDEFMRQRRRVDDASAGTFANQPDRAGRDGLSNQMADYSDSRNADRFMASCMEARGWPQPPRPWWQR